MQWAKLAHGAIGADLHPVPFTDPKTGREEARDLIPGALFGLEYATDEASRFRFFVVEADRATEPSRASSYNRKSHLRSIARCAAKTARTPARGGPPTGPTLPIRPPPQKRRRGGDGGPSQRPKVRSDAASPSFRTRSECQLSAQAGRNSWPAPE
ncbi:MAG: hypothetical protein ACJAVR_003479 [Paracoccaceae bacterium]|jgi:hypothetical protein